MRTVKRYKRAVAERKKKIEKAEARITRQYRKLLKIEERYILHLFNTGMYTTDLSCYEGHNVRLRALDSSGKEASLWLDELAFVEDGKLHLSSLDHGVLQWSEDENTYIHYYHGKETPVDILGFFDIRIDDD